MSLQRLQDGLVRTAPKRSQISAPAITSTLYRVNGTRTVRTSPSSKQAIEQGAGEVLVRLHVEAQGREHPRRLAEADRRRQLLGADERRRPEVAPAEAGQPGCREAGMDRSSSL